MAEDNQAIMDALRSIIPEQTLQLVQDHILAPQTPFQAARRAATRYAREAYGLLYPVLRPVLARAGDALSDSPDFVFFAVLVGVIALLVQVLVVVHRVMMFWTRLVTRALAWAAVAALLAVVWRRGPEATARDVVVFVSKMLGYAALVKDIWLAEYQRWDAQTKNSRKAGGSGSRARRAGR